MANPLGGVLQGEELAGFGAAIAEDAESLAALHDRELTAELVGALHEAQFPDGLALLPTTDSAQAAWQAMREAREALPRAIDAQQLDLLAAEYAAIYLTGAYGASPCESFWTDDDHLHCQEAMFQLRALYAASHLVTPNWRQRPDDHLVLQLLYIAHLARSAATADEWRALAKVLDEHLLRWITDFAARVAARSSAPFYGALAVLTAAWLETLRDAIARLLGEPRPSREEVEARLRPKPEPVAQPVTFVPGIGPGW